MYEVVLIVGIIISIVLLAVLVLVTRNALKKMTDEQLKLEEIHENEA